MTIELTEEDLRMIGDWYEDHDVVCAEHLSKETVKAEIPLLFKLNLHTYSEAAARNMRGE